MNDHRTSHLSAAPIFRFVRGGLVLLTVLLAVVAGCGGSGSGGGSGTSSTTSTPTPTPTPAPAPESTRTTDTGTPAADLGAKTFAQKCALCHGPDGHGDGPGSAALTPKPRNFHDKAYMATRTDAQLLEVIKNGKGAMPKWGALLSEAELKAVLAHVRDLGKKP